MSVSSSPRRYAPRSPGSCAYCIRRPEFLSPAGLFRDPFAVSRPSPGFPWLPVPVAWNAPKVPVPVRCAYIRPDRPPRFHFPDKRQKELFDVFQPYVSGFLNAPDNFDHPACLLFGRNVRRHYIRLRGDPRCFKIE